MQATIIFLLSIIAVVAAFAPLRITRNFPKTDLKMSTYWEGKAPSSEVLGVGAKIPSSVFGPLSLVAFALGTYCIHESNIVNQVTVDNIEPLYIAGSTLVPISWGMHVAAWIQKQNNF